MLTPLRILILEDSLTDTELMLNELRSSGLKLEWQRVETEPDYLTQLDRGWDVILADYSMPQFSAMRALRLLQQHGLDIPFIVVTGSISEEVAVETMKQGAADYLLKDRLTRLGQAVTHAVQDKKLRDEKQQAKAALQASEKRFQRLADNAQDIIYRYHFTPTRGFEYISPAVTAITGYTPEEYYADPDLIFKIIVHEDNLRLLQQWVTGKKLAQSAVLCWARKDGMVVWTEHSNVPIYDETGNLIAVEGIARDVTNRKQVEEAQRQQAERERLVAEIAQRIRQSLDLEEILSTTVKEVQQFLQADRVIIYRFQPDWSGVVVMESVATNWMSILGRTIEDPCFRESYIPHYRQGGVSATDDIHTADLGQCHLDLLAQFQVRANLAAPILQGERLWGLLVAHQCSGPRHWKPLEISLLNQLATQAAIAIQQAQLFNQVQQQAQRETIINQIVQTMRSTLVLDNVLQTTVDSLNEALEVSQCLIFQPNSEKQMRAHHISKASTDWEKLIGSPCELFDYYKDTLTQGNQVSVCGVNQTSASEVQAAARRFGTRAFLLTPLIYQQEYLGGIGLQQRDRDRQWTAEEMNLVRAIADQCAIAIQQAQLFNQVRYQAQREQLLNQISQALNSSLDPKHILQEIVNLVGKSFSIDRATIFSIDTEQIRILHEWRASDQVISVMNWQASIEEHLDLLDPASPASFHRVFHAPNYAKAPLTPVRSERIQQAQVLSALRVPIFIRDRLFGGLSLHTTTTHRTFTEDEIHLLQRIADQAAIALYNAQSYERLEQLVKERTEELEQQRQISEAANRAKSTFLTNMSHELRTPLTSILGYSQALLEQIFGPLNDKQRQYLERVHISGQHLLELINDLLDLSKIEAGREEMTLERLPVEEVCQECLSLIRERAISQGLQLSLVIAPDVTTCVADRRRLKQILVNLLSNAVKFTKAGSITLKIEPAEDTVKFSVIDTGIGIAEADQVLLFQPFQQLDSDLDRQYEGTGLGLALSHRLARLHGGNITLQSQLGYGSCFTLHLPERAVDTVGQQSGDGA
jgi:PAS domain S-box-containing protein